MFKSQSVFNEEGLNSAQCRQCTIQFFVIFWCIFWREAKNRKSLYFIKNLRILGLSVWI